jgi:alpha-1,6-mannosyltransferase
MTYQTTHLVDATLFYAKEGGGVRTYLNAKAKWFASQDRFRHTVVAPDIDLREADPEVHLVTVPGIAIPGGRHYRMPRSVTAAAEAICDLRPDLIEVGDPYQLAWSALRAGRECGVPVIAYYHSDLPNLVQRRFGPLGGRLAADYIAHLYRQFDLVIAPSKVMAARLRKLGVEQVVRQPLGVDTHIFSPERRTGTLRERLGLSPETRLLVFAGRFTREKQLPLLIDAVQRLGSPYHLVLIGAGDRLPAAPQCTCLPFQRNSLALAGLIADCDALVHCGDRETFGLVVLEAMACGIPVVGVAAGGIAELVDDEIGMRMQPGCVRALADSIDQLYQRDLRRLGRNARRKAVEEYDWKQVISRLAAHYDALVSAPRTDGFDAELFYAAD